MVEHSLVINQTLPARRVAAHDSESGRQTLDPSALDGLGVDEHLRRSPATPNHPLIHRVNWSSP